MVDTWALSTYGSILVRVRFPSPTPGLQFVQVVVKLYEDCYAKRDDKCAILNESLCLKRGSCPFYATKEEYMERLRKAACRLKEKGLRPCTKCDGKEMYQSTTKI